MLAHKAKPVTGAISSLAVGADQHVAVGLVHDAAGQSAMLLVPRNVEEVGKVRLEVGILHKRCLSDKVPPSGGGSIDSLAIPVCGEEQRSASNS
eukprot:1241227-Amphidinium_carterae.3